MFKKKPIIKNLSPLRSSDRRKIADQIISTFGVSVPAPQEPQTSTEPSDPTIPSQPTLSSIRTSLLPENTQTARFTTTHGKDLKEVAGTVYVGSHPGQDERILWFKLWDRMYPTVYTLWHNPQLLPLLHTPSFVMSKLQGGADLMTPGLARGPPFPTGARKDAMVAVASTTRPSVPMFVGVCEINVNELEQVAGAKGHAVRGMHWAGDEIWNWSPVGTGGLDEPEFLDGWDEVGGIGGLENAVEDLDLEEEDEDGEGQGGMPLPTNGDAKPKWQTEEAHEEETDDSPEPTTAEIDSAFRNAFIYAIHKAKSSNPNAPSYGIDFPILPTLLISHYVQPYLPIYNPKHTAFYTIKKTSWKNVKKFIKYLDKEMMVKSKDRNGGETVILDVDFKDRAFKDFQPYKLPSKPATDGTGPKPTSDSDPSQTQSLTLEILYRPAQKLGAVFPPSASNNPHGSYFTIPALKAALEAYISANGLLSPQNRRLIILDPTLFTIFTSTTADDKTALATGTIARDALLQRIITDSHLCIPYYVLLDASSGQNIEDVKPAAGAPPKALITLETRTGSKTATKVSGMEKFHINPQSLADELQKKCASSVSIAPLVGAAAKGGKVPVEIMIQGNQQRFVEEALERRGLRGKGGKGGAWIEVVDKTKGKGKGRR